MFKDEKLADQTIDVNICKIKVTEDMISEWAGGKYWNTVQVYAYVKPNTDRLLYLSDNLHIKNTYLR